MKISHPLTIKDCDTAAHLYWQAFGGKLGRVLAPDDKAILFIKTVIDPKHVIAAYDDDRLIGVAGFKSNSGSFVSGKFPDIMKIYGFWGGLWRGLALKLLSRDTDNTRFLMDGICVNRQYRGQGVGTLLLDEINKEAKRRGYSQVRLDVIDTNHRAKRLYERCGFYTVADYSIGPLSYIFGFKRATTMVRDIY